MRISARWYYRGPLDAQPRRLVDNSPFTSGSGKVGWVHSTRLGLAHVGVQDLNVELPPAAASSLLIQGIKYVSEEKATGLPSFSRYHFNTSRYAKALSDGSKPRAIYRLTVSSTSTRRVQGGPQFAD